MFKNSIIVLIYDRHKPLVNLRGLTQAHKDYHEESEGTRQKVWADSTSKESYNLLKRFTISELILTRNW
jgi:hypothetical protein